MATALSMVLCNAPPRLTCDTVAAELRRLDPEAAITELDADKGDVIAFRVGGAFVAVMVIDMPMPWSDLEGPCATSVMWPQCTDVVKSHSAHAIVSVMGQLTPLAQSALLTRLTAAVMAASDACLGVYWGNARMLVRKDVFCSFATDMLPDGPPFHIWVDVRVGRAGTGTSAGYTTGMQALGHKEFVAACALEPPVELRKRLESLSMYVLDNGPVLKNGHTVGESADEKIRIVYGASPFGHEGEVMQLEYRQAAPDKPWWKLW